MLEFDWNKRNAITFGMSDFLGHVSTDIFMTINDVISGADFEENMKPAPGNENFFPFFF